MARSSSLALLGAALIALTGCEAPDVLELRPRLPEQLDLPCEEVCESPADEDDCYHLSSCEDVLDLNDEPAVICHFWGVEG